MYSIEGRRSGYTYLSADTRAQQDDEFSNLGMLWVEQGQRLWSVAESNGKSCVGCHGPVQAMRGVAARYPAYDAVRQRVINLEQRINACRVKHQQATPFAYESQELLAIAALIGRQSRGLPVTVKIDGLAAQSYERGRTAYYQQRGQLGLSCAQCHQQHAGSRLRGELISQGQINGHPVYRQLWQTMGSTHRMFAWCNEAVRAEPYVYGSQEYVDLELFVKWLGRGLPVETPAIRR
ncbi:sulfur oxidation c-type cytochrome SoxA [Azohydromonas australica]|uniref:sulfur oxidation c-type cytochrome SoxA n=1 Tax=Azohydromonas australica TaxID=364039 RepID=UPI00040600FB|nr:sulfur oxidation c-type cytochrome SoxA [Azohydromonas australica]